MPKLVQALSAPRQKGQDLQKYICHPSVLKEMVNRLSLMKYSTELQRQLFQIQTFHILHVLYKWYEYNGYNVYMHFLTSLFTFFGGNGYLESRELRIYNYKTKDISVEFNTVITPQKLEKVKKTGSDFYIVSLLLHSGVDDQHQNLLIINLKNKTAYKIEPNYGLDHRVGKYVDIALKPFCKNLGVVYLGEYPGTCNRDYPIWVLRLLSLNNPKVNPIQHSGLCMFISVGRYVYGNQLTENKLIEFIVKFYKTVIKNICGN